MSLNKDKTYIVENGIEIENPGDRTTVVYSGGEASPVGQDFPVGTIYQYKTASGSTFWKKTDTGINDWRQLDEQDLNIVISSGTVFVSPDGNDSTGTGSFYKPFQTLTGVYDALVAGDITATALSPLHVDCDAAIIDQDPVDFSAYTNILISGKGPRTRLKATNANANLVTLGASSSLRSISFEGVTNASNWHVVWSGTGTGVGSFNDLFFNQGSNCLKVENTTGTFRISGSNSLILQNSGTCFEGNSNTTLTVDGFSILGDGTNTKGFVQNGDSQLFIFSGRTTSLGTLYEVNGDTGSCFYGDVSDTGSNVVFDQNGNSSVEVISGSYEFSKAVITNTSVIEGYFFNITPDDNQLRCLSELSVGLPGSGRESAFGQGDSTVLGMLVYTYDGSTYTDVSEDAASSSGSTFTFPNTNTNSAIYVGFAFDTVSPIQFYGIKNFITTAAVLGSGDIVFEYWNGAWTEFNHMQTQSDRPHQSLANDKFTDTGSFQALFDPRLEDDWAVNDPVSFGTNVYWIRLRISSSITTAPIFEKFKIHTNRMELESDGFQRMYGLSRIEEKFPITFGGLFSNVGKAPTDQDFYLSDNLGIAATGNSFPTNQDRAIIFSQFIPFELDTSAPVKLTISYFVDTALSGVIQWVVDWATSAEMDPVYTSTALAPTTFTNERNVTVLDTVGASENNKDRVKTIELEIPEAVTQQASNAPNSKLWLRLTRDVSGSDTYAGNAILTDFALFYTAWREGGYAGAIL